MPPFTILQSGFYPALLYRPVEIFNNRYDFKIPGSRKNSYKSNNLPESREADAQTACCLAAYHPLKLLNDWDTIENQAQPCIRAMARVVADRKRLTPLKKYLYSHKN